MRLTLIREFLVNRVVGIVSAGFTVLGNLETLLTLLGIEGGFMSSPIHSVILEFFSKYWGLLIPTYFSLVIANGIFKKTKRFLGDTVIATEMDLIPKKEEPNNGELYFWISVENEEELDLADCYADITVIKIQSDAEWLDWTHLTNTNLSKLTWPEFEEHKSVTVRRKSRARLNIARTTYQNRIAFIFERGDKTIHAWKEFYIEIAVNGTMDEKHIEALTLKGFLSLKSGMTDPFEMTGHISTEGWEGDELVKRTKKN